MGKGYLINDNKIKVIVQDLRDTLSKTKLSESEIEAIIAQAVEKEEEKYFCTYDEAKFEIERATGVKLSDSTFRRIITNYKFITKKKSAKSVMQIAIQSVDEYVEFSKYEAYDFIAEIKELKKSLNTVDNQLLEEQIKNKELEKELEHYKTLLQEQTVLDDYLEVPNNEPILSENEENSEIIEETTHENGENNDLKIEDEGQSSENEDLGLLIDQKVKEVTTGKVKKVDLIVLINKMDKTKTKTFLKTVGVEELKGLLGNVAKEKGEKAIAILEEYLAMPNSK